RVRASLVTLVLLRPEPGQQDIDTEAEALLGIGAGQVGPSATGVGYSSAGTLATHRPAATGSWSSAFAPNAAAVACSRCSSMTALVAKSVKSRPAFAPPPRGKPPPP